MKGQWCAVLFQWPKKKLHKTLLILVSLVVILVPRIVQLGQVSTIDEKTWAHRSHQFIDFVRKGEFQNTILRHHPGVTLMWITGPAGYLAEGIDYVRMGGSLAKFVFSPIATSYEYQLSDRTFALKVRQTSVALVNSFVTLFACIWFGIALNSCLAMFLIVLMLGLDPFYLGLSRIIHCDGLMATFGIGSCAAMFRYLLCENHQIRWVILSGILAALSMLSKITGAIIIPWVVVVLFVFSWLCCSDAADTYLSRCMAALKWMLSKISVWCLTLAAVFWGVWPAMWVIPEKALAMFVRGAVVATEGAHMGSTASLLQQDVGILSYLPRILIFSAPWMVWIYVAGIASFFYFRFTANRNVGIGCENEFWKSHYSNHFRWNFIGSSLIFLAILVVIALGSFEKQAGRYILTGMLAINISGAIILCHIIFVGLTRPILEKRIIFSLIACLILWCGVTVNKWTPYATGYRNPIWGNMKVDGRPLLRGWGEGLEKAAHVLNALEGGEDLIVAARRYWVLGTFLKGKAVDYSKLDKVKVDYIVLYDNFFKMKPNSPFIKKITSNCEPFRQITIKPFGDNPIAYIYEANCYYNQRPKP